MMKQWSFVLAMLMAMAIIVMSGCGGDGGGPGSGSTNTGGGDGAVTHPYLMTAVGSNWTYSDGSTDKITANSNGALTMESVDGTYKDIATAVVSGTAITISQATSYENNLSQETQTNSPAWIRFPSSTAIGFTETQSVTMTYPGGSEKDTITITVKGVETVTVTAGTFQNALKIQFNSALYDNEYYWFAPGVGLLKVADAATNTVTSQLVSYSATAPTSQSYSISGTITSGGTALAGVTVTLSGSGSTTAITDSSGNYTFSGAQNGSYTVTPSKSGYTFTPTSQSVMVNGVNITSQNFTAATSSSSPATSLLDISNWDIGRGTAAMSNGLLTVGATHGDVIRTKQTYNQPVTFTFKAWFPDSILSGHGAGIGQAPLDVNGYPSNTYMFYTEWVNQNSLFMNYPSVTRPLPSILAATKSNGYFYGDFKMEWKNNAVVWYFDGSKVGEQPFTSTNPVYFYFNAYDREFKIESISVDLH